MPDALPVIDIYPYLSPSSTSAERADAAAAIHAACRDVGFFYLRVDGFLSYVESDGVLDAARAFFARPQTEKDAIGLQHGDLVRGYQRLHQNVTQGKADHHEGLDLYAPNPYPPREVTAEHPLRPLEGDNQWPAHPPDLRPKLEAWVNKMKTLGMAVMRAMADGLGMSASEWDELRGMVDDSFWVMRAIGYPPLPDGMDGVSCGEHKDYGCLTLLHADPCPRALQVLRAETWVDADPLPGCFVVNIGEMWERWTGGLYPATLHRVVHRAPVYRVSIPFFFEPNFGASVRVLHAARRVAVSEGRRIEDGGEVVYGDFLKSKVEGNFKYCVRVGDGG
ncbi:hypothetical protein Q5752_005781 [Cryptotrichosporon argae]